MIKKPWSCNPQILGSINLKNPNKDPRFLNQVLMALNPTPLKP